MGRRRRPTRRLPPGSDASRGPRCPTPRGPRGAPPRGLGASRARRRSPSASACPRVRSGGVSIALESSSRDTSTRTALSDPSSHAPRRPDRWTHSNYSKMPGESLPPTKSRSRPAVDLVLTAAFHEIGAADDTRSTHHHRVLRRRRLFAGRAVSCDRCSRRGRCRRPAPGGEITRPPINNPRSARRRQRC